ncbi:hypothetical protein MSL71_27510 [Desulfoluna butyratoxydans]|uniref:Uncharacterized protein n=1 Tax=Desulfoluna butyratoxydans TaxID=231438 RepID=A0A4U8YNB6_9BACT|nr:hypothetical protein MSL71_27510 [Desulfoluna butyratoxydans]
MEKGMFCQFLTQSFVEGISRNILRIAVVITSCLP